MGHAANEDHLKILRGMSEARPRLKHRLPAHPVPGSAHGVRPSHVRPLGAGGTQSYLLSLRSRPLGGTWLRPASPEAKPGPELVMAIYGEAEHRTFYGELGLPNSCAEVPSSRTSGIYLETRSLKR